jgi:hypothetical protein
VWWGERIRLVVAIYAWGSEKWGSERRRNLRALHRYDDDSGAHERALRVATRVIIPCGRWG